MSDYLIYEAFDLSNPELILLDISSNYIYIIKKDMGKKISELIAKNPNFDIKEYLIAGGFIER